MDLLSLYKKNGKSIRLLGRIITKMSDPEIIDLVVVGDKVENYSLIGKIIISSRSHFMATILCRMLARKSSEHMGKIFSDVKTYDMQKFLDTEKFRQIDAIIMLAKYGGKVSSLSFKLNIADTKYIKYICQYSNFSIRLMTSRYDVTTEEVEFVGRNIIMGKIKYYELDELYFTGIMRDIDNPNLDENSKNNIITAVVVSLYDENDKVSTERIFKLIVSLCNFSYSKELYANICKVALELGNYGYRPFDIKKIISPLTELLS